MDAHTYKDLIQAHKVYIKTQMQALHTSWNTTLKAKLLFHFILLRILYITNGIEVNSGMREYENDIFCNLMCN